MKILERHSASKNGYWDLVNRNESLIKYTLYELPIRALEEVDF